MSRLCTYNCIQMMLENEAADWSDIEDGDPAQTSHSHHGTFHRRQTDRNASSYSLPTAIYSRHIVLFNFVNLPTLCHLLLSPVYTLASRTFNSHFEPNNTRAQYINTYSAVPIRLRVLVCSTIGRLLDNRCVSLI